MRHLQTGETRCLNILGLRCRIHGSWTSCSFHFNSPVPCQSLETTLYIDGSIVSMERKVCWSHGPNNFWVVEFTGSSKGKVAKQQNDHLKRGLMWKGNFHGRGPWRLEQFTFKVVIFSALGIFYPVYPTLISHSAGNDYIWVSTPFLWNWETELKELE